MRVLLVDIPALLENPLRHALGARHQLIDLDGDSRDLETCRRAAGTNVIVHGHGDLETSDPGLALDRAGRTTWNLLTMTSAGRYVQLSTMRMFDTYDPGWDLTESWQPRPTTDHRQLAPYLAERAAREITRVRPITAMCLRLDDVVSAETFQRGPLQSTWLHLEDAVDAIIRAVEVDDVPAFPRWRAVNIVRGDRGSRFPNGLTADSGLGFRPQYTGDGADAPVWPPPAWPAEPAPVTDLGPPRNAVIFGAGGPLAAATAPVLGADVTLRLCDLRPLAEIAAGQPQSSGAPLPAVPQSPHEERQVDVTDPAAVLEAARGMDTIINCSVIRPDPVQAFRVNMLGAWNVMQAAVALGIRRVVHTGPTLILGVHPSGYNEDRWLGPDAPPRPGDSLYFVSKFLGTEICRVVAEQHGIACITLLFDRFLNVENAEIGRDERLPPFAVSWNDAGRAMAAATRLPSLDRAFEVVQVMAGTPHGRYQPGTAREVIDWAPTDRLDRHWYRR